MNEKTTKIKNIISFFIGIEAGKIGFDTLIDNSIIQGSVKIHMMYGELADNGYKISNYSKIKTFGELLKLLNLDDELNETNLTKQDNFIQNELVNKTKKFKSNSGSVLDSTSSPSTIGVDLLNINKLPQVSDFRESNFYTDNFSLQEIAYCLTKKDPYKSFAGKFAAKEAIVKANNKYKNYNFNEIEVLNDTNGMPYFANLSVSISHNDNLAIAIASSKSNSNIKKVLATEEQASSDTIENKSTEIHNDIISKKKKTNYNRWLFFSLVLNIVFGSYIIYVQFFN
jgi:holo-[acyl-carrier protein] synthase